MRRLARPSVANPARPRHPSQYIHYARGSRSLLGCRRRSCWRVSRGHPAAPGHQGADPLHHCEHAGLCYHSGCSCAPRLTHADAGLVLRSGRRGRRQRDRLLSRGTPACKVATVLDPCGHPCRFLLSRRTPRRPRCRCLASCTPSPAWASSSRARRRWPRPGEPQPLVRNPSWATDPLPQPSSLALRELEVGLMAGSSPRGLVMARGSEYTVPQRNVSLANYHALKRGRPMVQWGRLIADTSTGIPHASSAYVARRRLSHLP